MSRRNDRTDISRLLLAQDEVTPLPAISDHGELSGLTDDDHPQYHNDARGDARYSQLPHTHPPEYPFLDDVLDVQLVNRITGQVLTYDGSKWINQALPAPPAAILDALTDVTIATPANNQVLTYESASSQWKNKIIQSHNHAGSEITSGTVAVARLGTGTPSSARYLRGDGTWQDLTLDSLFDVAITTPQNDQAVIYDTTTSSWKNKPVPQPSLDYLTDVGIYSPTDGQTLIYNTGQWNNGYAPQEISFQFTSVGNGYYVTTNNCTISLGQEGGTGTLAYNIAPDNSSSFGGAVTLPQALTAGQTLRVVCTGLTGFKAVTLVKT